MVRGPVELSYLVASLVLREGDAGSGSTEDDAALGRYFAGWPVPFADEAAALDFLGELPIADVCVAALERRDGGLRPRFEVDVMAGCIRFVMECRRDEWTAVQARTLVVWADNGMFSEMQKAAFVGHGPGTSRVDLACASHDTHLDQFGPWIAALGGYLSESLADSDR